MRPHRLGRLTFLTQGIALVGFGMTLAACPRAPNINGPPDYDPYAASKTPAADAAGTPAPSASPSSNDQADAATPAASQRPILNAPPRDAAAPPSLQLPIMNAPPQGGPLPPSHTNGPPKT